MAKKDKYSDSETVNGVKDEQEGNGNVSQAAPKENSEAQTPAANEEKSSSVGKASSTFISAPQSSQTGILDQLKNAIREAEQCAQHDIASAAHVISLQIGELKTQLSQCEEKFVGQLKEICKEIRNFFS